MRLTNSQYDSIMRSYEERRRISRQTLEDRTRLIYEKIPEYEELDRRIASFSIENVRLLLSGRGASPDELKKEIRKLSARKSALLTQNGYPADFLAPVYKCSRCRDTGYIGKDKCSCFKAAEIDLIYEQSHIKNLLLTENFSQLSYDYYDGDDLEKFTKAVQICQNFIENFDKDYHNLFFYGTVGTGKSFLSCCVAKELIDRGHLVIYLSSTQLFEAFSKDMRGKDNPDAASGISEDIYGCDLLIIDDLGTEIPSSFVSSQLFSCLNNRILREKSTIINTNISLEELRSRYSDRIFSRIMGYYDVCKLTGNDIRMKKKTNRK